MSKLDILMKIIALLHREHLLLITSREENSTELVLTILKTLSNGRNVAGGDSIIVEDLKYLINDMVKYPDNYSTESLMQSLELILKDHKNILTSVAKYINIEMSNAGMKRSIVALRNTLNNFYKEKQASSLISKASYDLLTNKLSGETVQEYVGKLITNLDALITTTKGKDLGVVDEIDLSDEDKISGVMEKVKVQNAGIGKLITGWKALNRMTQGGFRRGEYVMISALQHNFKSSFLRSLFIQLATLNTPVMTDNTKKPLLLFISFEDNVDIALEFMYKYLYYNERNELPDMSTIKTKDMAKYLTDKLSVNGYNIKMIRVNPSDWSYKDLFNKILKYEADGYELHAVLLDYLAKLPTTGCITGPAGADYKDLYTRTFNFFTAKGITFITPHQLSTEAKQLIRNGEPDISFVKSIKGKGYFDNSRALDQIVDLELYLHIAKLKKKKVLTVGMGKHRMPSIVDEEHQYFTLPFIKGVPIIKEDLHSEESEDNNSVGDDDEFDF